MGTRPGNSLQLGYARSFLMPPFVVAEIAK
jgi:hypothetical protein